MATVLRNTDPLAGVIAAAHNDIKAQLGPSSSYHLDKSERTVTADDATDLASLLELANACAAVYAFHLADTLAHIAADDENVVTSPKATDLASAITLGADLKTQYNNHRADTEFHYNADSTNVVTESSSISSEEDAETLLNDIKAQLNAHMSSGPAAASIRLVDA